MRVAIPIGITIVAAACLQAPAAGPAVNGNFNGDLVVPAYIDGLPVRKVNEAAFIECSLLRSVRFPHTLREIGARAFVDCL